MATEADPISDQTSNFVNKAIYSHICVSLRQHDKSAFTHISSTKDTLCQVLSLRVLLVTYSLLSFNRNGI